MGKVWWNLSVKMFTQFTCGVMPQKYLYLWMKVGLEGHEGNWWQNYPFKSYCIFLGNVKLFSNHSISHHLIPRRLLRFMRSSHQVCGFLREVSPAIDALPVLPRMHLSLQLQPSERRRLGRWQQRARRSPSKSSSGITSLTPHMSLLSGLQCYRQEHWTLQPAGLKTSQLKPNLVAKWLSKWNPAAFWERYLSYKGLAKAKSKTLVVQNSCFINCYINYIALVINLFSSCTFVIRIRCSLGTLISFAWQYSSLLCHSQKSDNLNFTHYAQRFTVN